MVKDKLLDAIPTDPMDGQPLRYRRTDVGIVVYSIGDDDTDNQGNIYRDQHDQRWVDIALRQREIDIGFRLWNVTQRRQPPMGP